MVRERKESERREKKEKLKEQKKRDTEKESHDGKNRYGSAEGSLWSSREQED